MLILTAQVVALLILLVGPLLTAHLILSRARSSMGTAARWTATGCIGYGVTLGLFHLASAFHRLEPYTLVGLTLLGLAVAFLLRKRGGTTRAWPELHRLVLELVRLPFVTLFVLLPFVLVSTIAVARALLMPPLAWDALTYHLVFVARWVQEGRIVGFSAPDAMDLYSHFPVFGDVATALFMLPFHGDLLVNLAQMPFVFLLGLAVYGLGREYGLSRHLAIVGMLCVVYSPVVFAYATTAYVDTQATAFIVAGALFLLRYWRGGERVDSLLVAFCCGCALGIKLTTIYAGAVLLAILFIRMAMRGNRRRFVWIPVHLALLLAIGTGKYVENWLDTGNPVYPYAFKLGPVLLAPESKFVNFFTAAADPGSLVQDLKCLRATFSYAPSPLPLTPGPKFVFLAVLALLSVLQPGRRRSGGYWILLALGFLAPLLFFSDSSPQALVIRRIWPYSAARFLTGSLAALTVLGLGWLDVKRKTGKVALFALYGLLGFDLLSANVKFLSPAAGYFLVLTLLLLLAIAGGTLLIRQPSWRFRAALALSLLALATAGPALTALSKYRENNRFEHYRKHIDLNAFITTSARGWEFIERSGSGRTLAFTTGFLWPGQFWYMYPLYGSNLQNRVVYASVKRRGDWPTHVDSGMLREGGDAGVWMDNLRRLNVDWIVVQWPAPDEFFWMKSRPSQFRVVFEDEKLIIFSFDRSLSEKRTSTGK